MKNYLEQLKKRGWKKVTASLIIGGTILFFGIILAAVILFVAFLALSALWHSYKESPAPFHYLIGFLTISWVWMWLWDWAERQ